MKILKSCILLFIFIYSNELYSVPSTCDFWGYATFYGRNVTSGDVIQAFDTAGHLWGTSYVISNGLYGIHVWGDDPQTIGVDEGFTNGEQVIFKINGIQADLIGGHNKWLMYENIQADIQVRLSANPGGPYAGLEGATGFFNGSRSSGAVTYQWDFGDGSTGSGPTFNHVYVDDGNFTTTLRVEGSLGNVDVKTTVVTIQNVPPSVNASCDSPKGEGSEVHFTGNATDPGVLDVLSYSWSFGDGSTSGQMNPSHVYVNSGLYFAVLTVNDGDRGSASKTISVNVLNENPIVQAGNNVMGSEGESISFNGSAYDPGILDQLTYNWNFGDGQFAIGKELNHVFTHEGDFRVQLTVTDGDGGNGYDELSAHINNMPPTANAGEIYYAIVHYPLQIHGSCTDPGSSDTFIFQWDLDEDGQYDDFIGQEAVFVYDDSGTFEARLKVTDDGGGFDVDTAVVNVSTDIPISFKSLPPGLPIYIDGNPITTPANFHYQNGSEITIKADSILYETAGRRLKFINWSDNESIEHKIIVAPGKQEYTAIYKEQYLLDIDEGGILGNVKGEGYYDIGTQVAIEVDSVAMDSSHTTLYHFNQWIGAGNGSYSGPQINPLITVNSVINERIVWSLSGFFLNVKSDYGNPIGAGFYDSNAEVMISIDSLVMVSPFSRVRFFKWDGSGSGSYSGTDNPVKIVVNSPICEIASWKKQYKLTILNHDSAMGRIEITPYRDWFDGNDSVSVRAIPNEGFVFRGWTNSLKSSSPFITFCMDTSKNLEAHFSITMLPTEIVNNDTSFAEDDSLKFSIDVMLKWLYDDKNTFSIQNMEFSETLMNFHTSFDSRGIAIWADEDWNGRGWVLLDLRDEYGNSRKDTVFCTVIPVNDPPFPFYLISPNDSVKIDTSLKEINFKWRSSHNVDIENGDKIKYQLILSSEQKPVSHTIGTQDTVISLTADLFTAGGSFTWYVIAVDNQDIMTYSSSQRTIFITEKAGFEDKKILPHEIKLFQNYPNPFNSNTIISYDVPIKQNVKIEIFSVNGILVKKMIDKVHNPGEYQITWDGTSDFLLTTESSVYLCRMTLGNSLKVIKIVHIK